MYLYRYFLPLNFALDLHLFHLSQDQKERTALNLLKYLFFYKHHPHYPEDYNIQYCFILVTHIY